MQTLWQVLTGRSGECGAMGHDRHPLLRERSPIGLGADGVRRFRFGDTRFVSLTAEKVA